MEDAGPLSVLKTDTLRAILTLVVPGGIALLPWCCLLAQRQPALLNVAAKHDVLSALAVTVAALAMGNALNGFGSWWEALVNDRLLKRKRFESLEQDWYTYLRLYFPKEPPGVGYLRRMVTTLKFELNTGMSLFVFAFGLVAIKLYGDHFAGWDLFCSLVVVLAVALMFLVNSYLTSSVLARLRSELAKGILIPAESEYRAEMQGTGKPPKQQRPTS